MYLELFGDLLSFAENRRWSIIYSEYRPTVTKNNRSMKDLHHRSTTSHPRVNDKFEDCK